MPPHREVRVQPVENDVAPAEQASLVGPDASQGDQTQGISGSVVDVRFIEGLPDPRRLLSFEDVAKAPRTDECVANSLRSAA